MTQTWDRNFHFEKTRAFPPLLDHQLGFSFGPAKLISNIFDFFPLLFGFCALIIFSLVFRSPTDCTHPTPLTGDADLGLIKPHDPASAFPFLGAFPALLSMFTSQMRLPDSALASCPVISDRHCRGFSALCELPALVLLRRLILTLVAGAPLPRQCFF